MSTDQAIAFVLFAVVAAVTPGPSNIILASMGANVGVWRGLPSLFGVVLGMAIMMAIVAFSVGSLVMTRPLLLEGLNWVAIGFLLWLSWKIGTASGDGPAPALETIGFWQAAAFQWVNPKSWLVSASAAGAFLSGNGGVLGQAIWFGLLFVLAALPGCLVWLALGATARRLLQSERARRTFNIAMGALLAGSALLYLV